MRSTGSCTLVMEWVDGEPLNIIMKYAATRGGIPLAIAVSIAAQTCRGLHAAHELRDESGTLVGLVHRDVSPQNVLLTYEGVVKVVDFGVAKATSRASNETEAGQLKGKIAYMSPEQLRGERIDRRTDVFAMGILLYMMTTGTHPFRGDDQAQTIRRISSGRAGDRCRARSFPATPRGSKPSSCSRSQKRRLQALPDRQRHADRPSRARSPPSMRPSTDEEVAEFLRALFARIAWRSEKSAIKGALEAADRREAGNIRAAHRRPAESPPDEPPTVLEGLVSSREVTPSAEGHTSSCRARARRVRRSRCRATAAARRGAASYGMGLSAALVRRRSALIVALRLSRSRAAYPPSAVSSQPALTLTPVLFP